MHNLLGQVSCRSVSRAWGKFILQLTGRQQLLQKEPRGLTAVVGMTACGCTPLPPSFLACMPRHPMSLAICSQGLELVFCSGPVWMADSGPQLQSGIPPSKCELGRQHLFATPLFLFPSVLTAAP
jgi:hypothetical protein